MHHPELRWWLSQPSPALLPPVAAAASLISWAPIPSLPAAAPAPGEVPLLGTKAARKWSKLESPWCLKRAAATGFLGSFSTCVHVPVSPQASCLPCLKRCVLLHLGSEGALWAVQEAPVRQPCCSRACLCPDVLCHHHDVPSLGLFLGCGNRSASIHLTHNL